MSVFLRFRLRSDDTVQDDGAHIDDISLNCVTTPSATGDYLTLKGTSMATAHVAGVAALVLALNPAATPAQVRHILLSTVDSVAGLSGVVATGGRLNARSAVAKPVDNTKPNTTITAGPAKKTKSKTATLKFKSTEAGSTFKCRLDKRAWTACKSSKTYRKLKKGSHTFRVVATDKSGNVDGTPAKRTWRVT